MKAILPLFYHPTNVLLLDDDQAYLNRLLGKVDESFAYAVETAPSKALLYLRSHVYNPQQLSESLIQQNFDVSTFDKYSKNIETFDLNIESIRGDLSSSERFKKIVVGVVDRYMPGMDGLLFCKMIREEYRLPVKFILLTGATTEKEAIDAFNAGTIAGYIEKSKTEKMIPKLNQMIKKLAWQQFYELSKQMLGFMPYQFSHIEDKQYVELFEKTGEEENTIEFYLYDSSGSFLLLDKNGNAKIFFVRTEHDFEMIYELAKNGGAFKNVLEAIKNRQKFPYAKSNKSYLRFNDEAWESAMIQMSKIPGRDLFYSLIDLPSQDFMGFKQYMGQVWPRP